MSLLNPVGSNIVSKLKSIMVSCLFILCISSSMAYGAAAIDAQPDQSKQALRDRLQSSMPDFTCKMKPVKHNGGVSDQIRKAKKTKRNYRRCIKKYKSTLAILEKSINKSIKVESNETEKNFMNAQLVLIQHIQSMDLLQQSANAKANKEVPGSNFPQNHGG